MKCLLCLTSVATLLTLFVFPSKIALAEDDIIKKLDLDKDGHITIKEAVAEPFILAKFGMIDRNGDGKISKAELKHAKISIRDKSSELES